MSNYVNIKICNTIYGKNAEDNEQRSEIITATYVNLEDINQRDIHNKRKDYR